MSDSEESVAAPGAGSDSESSAPSSSQGSNASAAKAAPGKAKGKGAPAPKKSEKKPQKKGGKDKKKSNVEVMKNPKEALVYITDFFKRNNRPYNAQHLLDGSGGRLKKTLVEKSLTELCDNGTLTFREIKKAKIYQYNQSKLPVIPESELERLDKKIASLTEESSSLDSQVLRLAQEVKSYKLQMTDSELKEAIKKLKADNEAKSLKLKELKDSGRVVGKEHKERVLALYETSRKEWRKRKRMSNDLIDILCGESRSVKELRDEVGVETDEENKFTLQESEIDISKWKRQKV